MSQTKWAESRVLGKLTGGQCWMHPGWWCPPGLPVCPQPLGLNVHTSETLPEFQSHPKPVGCEMDLSYFLYPRTLNHWLSHREGERPPSIFVPNVISRETKQPREQGGGLSYPLLSLPTTCFILLARSK